MDITDMAKVTEMAKERGKGCPYNMNPANLPFP
jgi:hypothetical protein